jgi:hypothetical protein
MLKNAQETSQIGAKQIIEISMLTKDWSCRSNVHETTHRSPTPNFPHLKQIYQCSRMKHACE